MTGTAKGVPCIGRDKPTAEVRKTQRTTIIAATPLLADCEPFRYRIRNDGSGGVK